MPRRTQRRKFRPDTANSWDVVGATVPVRRTHARDGPLSGPTFAAARSGQHADIRRARYPHSWHTPLHRYQ
jgi:hypothetical protein